MAKLDTIIEPFAGSASYALHYYEKNVILCDKDPVICAVWNYLIQATKEQILALPILSQGESLDDYELAQAEKYLIGFFLGFGAKPRKRPTKCANFCNWTVKNREILSNDVLKVKHWKIHNGSYEELKNIQAVWFIDPPYQGNGGRYYSYNQIDYEALAEWAMSRKGQVVVCENEEATWLPFHPLLIQSQYGKKHTEMMYWLVNLPKVSMLSLLKL